MKLLSRQKDKEDACQLLTECHEDCHCHQQNGTKDSERYHNEVPGCWRFLNQQNKAKKSSLWKEHVPILTIICVAWEQGNIGLQIIYRSLSDKLNTCIQNSNFLPKTYPLQKSYMCKASLDFKPFLNLWSYILYLLNSALK